MKNTIKINPADNVAVALIQLSGGTSVIVEGEEIKLLSDIPMGHKFALRTIEQGENIIKYGYPIGNATRNIERGEHVHTHNVQTNLSQELEYTWNPVKSTVQEAVAADSFMGYPRADGRVGIRNELWILPTVGCVNDIAKALERKYQYLLGPSIDHVYAFPHPLGCSQMGDDQENTRKILARLAAHPNVGGVLVLGLGCENSGIERIREKMEFCDTNRVRFMKCQDAEDEMEAAGEILLELSGNMRKDKRVPCDLSSLIVGLKCGGSDGFSGITANPVIGGFSDLMIERGGSTVMTEVPEMFGSETILMNRCTTEECFQKTVRLINDFKRYFLEHHQVVYENPSPGNKDGGLTTLEDKALGCTQKSGFAPVRDVLGYSDSVKVRGLNLLSAPGNDLVAATALAASGCQMILFSTGRGTPYACPVPTLKIATNSVLAEKKRNWIDFDAGRLLETGDISELSEMLYRQVIAVANGEQVVSEKLGFHDLTIFKQGVTV